jgi:hypothetical protein
MMWDEKSDRLVVVFLLITLTVGNFSFACLWWSARHRPVETPPPVPPVETANENEVLAQKDDQIFELRARNADLIQRLENALRSLKMAQAHPPPRPVTSASGSGPVPARPPPDPSVERYRIFIAENRIAPEAGERLMSLLAERRLAGLSMAADEVAMDPSAIERMASARADARARIDEKISDALGPQNYEKFQAFERGERGGDAGRGGAPDLTPRS